MIIQLESAENGAILRYSSEYDDGSERKVITVFDFEEGGKEAVATLLGTIRDLLGESGGRYDKERVYVTVEPGDKYEDTGVSDE